MSWENFGKWSWGEVVLFVNEWWIECDSVRSYVHPRWETMVGVKPNVNLMLGWRKEVELETTQSLLTIFESAATWIALTISAPAVKLCCADDFLVGNDSVFINDFWVSYAPFMLTISTLVAKLCCVDDFWVGRDSVFVNDFCISSGLRALAIFAE
jgi:hypothetical protein